MKIRGFTLIEVLIALLIFSIVAAITSSVLYQMFDTRAHTRIFADRVQEMQMAYVILNRDFRQAVPKPVFYNSTIELQPFTGQESQVSFTRGGYSNPLQKQRRSELQRISLQVRDGQLFRRRFDKLDHESSDHGAEQPILSHVQQMTLRYYGSGKISSNFWPSAVKDKDQPLPSSIALDIEFTDWGKLTWVFQCRGS